ncbi:hypothetical protein [Mucilaginibacter sp.]|uniref:hypothetical protein n=1 Tax=Mucilaginibacter sp. TaxID=1882438 RepID=UPI0026233708|nr:hypothetical protein [Mucilaginibacter sp.]MDB4921037.1 hypothetical protein [Mucilaginibacter sp.]
MKKHLSVIGMALSCLVLMQSCKKDIATPNNTPVNNTVTAENAVVNKSQITFAKILAKAVKDDAALRSFLKDESLKQFDNDHDVLYQMIKDTKINGTETLHEKLVRFAASKEELEAVEQQLPLLTIFVPTLPNFSPEKWNSSTEVPVVAVSNTANSGVLFYDDKGKESTIAADEIPGFPVLLIKQNERVVVGTSTKLTSNSIGSSAQSSSVYNGDGLVLNFADEAFNNVNPKVKTNKLSPNRVTGASGIDPINIAAYNSGNEWHRDYIYYGLTASNPRGQFKNNYSEFITTMRFLTPDALNMIADQDGDPKMNPAYGHHPGFKDFPSTMWTDGNFEFRITVLINSKNGLGNDLTKVISVRPGDLFDLQYTMEESKPLKILIYKLKSITPKEYHPNVELVPWDLQNYGTAWKFIVYEYDNSQEVTQSYENTTTFAANFEITNSSIEKIGLKFGASATTSEKRTFSVKTTLTSDYLGEATLSFDQPVITSFDGTNYNTREITTGNILSLGIEPKRVF